MRMMMAGLLCVGVVAGCGGSAGRQAEETADAAPPARGTESGSMASADTGAAMGMAHSTPDARFLMMMSDHHQGLIELSRRAGSSGTDAATVRDARMLATKQEAEQKEMLQRLQQESGMAHRPQTMPMNARTIDSVAALQGQARQQAFYAAVIAHHREGIAVMDSAMPTLQDSMVRSMAKKMKQEQQREITTMQPKASGSGGSGT